MIGKKIKELADKKGLTNEQVALGLDMTVSNLYKIYKKDSINTEILAQMAKFFGVSISYFFEDFYNLTEVAGSAVAGDIVLHQIPDSATAGYGNGNYNGYTKNDLETMSIRKLLKIQKGDFVVKVEGTSMEPTIPDGEILICSKTSISEAKDGRVYVFIVQYVGKTVKRLQKISKDEIVLVSDNTTYQPQRVRLEDVVEIYEIKSRINTNSIS